MNDTNQQQEFSQPATTSDDQLTLGQWLQAARKLQQLTQQDIADKLYLGISMVVDIENDQIDSEINPVFSKGYINNYAKLVSLDTTHALNLFERQYQDVGAIKNMQSFSQRTKAQLHNRYLNWVTVIIMIGFVAMIIAWWWQQQAADNVAEPLTELTEQTSVNLDADNLNQIVPSLTQVLKIDELNTPQLSGSPEAQSPQANGTTTIGLVFSQDCWIKITDASNDVLAIGIKQAGEVLDISGLAPFEVTLGAPDAVSITYQGKALDISRYIIDNAARFSVPLEQ